MKLQKIHLKLQKIHLYWCILQIVSLFFLYAYGSMIISFIPIPVFAWIFIVMTLITFFIGAVTLPFYFAKKIHFEYKLLSILNLLVGLYMIVGVLLRFEDSSIMYLSFVLGDLLIFIVGLYTYWKKKK
jgi:hypothetical protein